MTPSQAQYSTALCRKLQGWWRRQAYHLALDPAHPLLRALSAPAPRFLIVLEGQSKA
jgi:hypothetical protein